MAVGYRHPRGTRAALNALATAGTLVVGQVYVITDENRLAVALTASTYETFAKAGEAAVRGLSAFCSGKPAASEIVGAGIAPYALTLSAANSQATGNTAATGSTVFIIRRAGTQIGTITFSASATSGVVALTQTAITSGQNITITAPATPDATLSDISFLLRE